MPDEICKVRELYCKNYDMKVEDCDEIKELI